MKKFTLVLVTCLMLGILTKAQYVNIPDSNFKKILLGSYPACFNVSGQIDTSCSEILQEDSLFCSNDSIKDLTGIQFFKNLSFLSCDSNQLAYLPALPRTLHYLFCSHNLLSALPTLPDSLLYLSCQKNQLTSLPILSNLLTNISCEENQLKDLPKLPDSLKLLVCAFNQLKELPTLPVFLNTLDCGSNLLTTIPVLPLNLKYFYFYDNQFTSLPLLPNNISLLDCGNNQIKSLPTLPDTLNSLDCGSNQLSSLPYKLPKGLNYLNVSSNPISFLPAFDSLRQLLYLYCQGDTNLMCLPRLPNSLDSLNVSNTGVRCIPNNFGNDKVYPNGLTICNPTNNINQCNAFPSISGRVFYDNNNNGVKDSDEFYIPYITVKLNTGQAVLSNDAGQYTITMADTGNVNLMVMPSPHYKVIPENINLSFTSFEQKLTLPDIAIQANILKDSLGIKIYPWQNALVGRKIAYSVSYKSLGTINSNDTIRFAYDSSKLFFDSSSVTLLSHNGNELVWLDTVSANYFGNQYFRNGYKFPFFIFSIKPNVALGASLLSTATISSATTYSTTSDSIIVKGSYDPNSKDATSELTTTQLKNGERIDYTIHFQNVGNAVANNIVIADTLSSLLNPSEFQIIGHNYFPSAIGFSNNIVYFQFLNINLVDSGSNQLMSNGFIHFSVQPHDTVSSGSYIHNKASIYFDYNDPVVTNMATTAIKNIPLPVSISSYQLSQANGNVAIIQNNWTTVNELNTKSFKIQRSVDGVDFTTIGNVLAKGSGVNNYQFTDYSPVKGINYYRLQIIDKNGNISYSKKKSIQLSINIYQLSIFPNPAKDFIRINGKNIKEVSVIDNVGRIVARKILNVSSFENKLEFKLAYGFYTVQLKLADDNFVNKKIMVE